MRRDRSSGSAGEVMLAILTPTRGRWDQLLEQAQTLKPQLGHDDLWIIGCDRSADEDAAIQIAFMIEPRQNCWIHFDYLHESNVNRLRNALAAFAPPTHDIVELDDHDTIAPHALSEIRHALEAGYDYVFGWHRQVVAIEQPDGSLQDEVWPTVERDYTPGAFARHEYDAIGLRAIRRSLWDKLGGWGTRFPGGHYDLAQRAEALGARIVCLQTSLCAVRVEPEHSICGLYHQLG